MTHHSIHQRLARQRTAELHQAAAQQRLVREAQHTHPRTTSRAIDRLAARLAN